MIITGWQIDCFGVFQDFRIENLQKGITVITGPNGSGKTTLLGFLRSMLFGLTGLRGRRKQKDLIPSIHDGTISGRIFLSHSGLGLSISRKTQPHKTQLHREDDSQADQQDLDRLLGGMNRALFENLFAFGLEELAISGTFTKSGVRELIESARLPGWGPEEHRELLRMELQKEQHRLMELFNESGLVWDEDRIGELPSPFCPLEEIRLWKSRLDTVKVQLEKASEDYAEASEQCRIIEQQIFERQKEEARSIEEAAQKRVSNLAALQRLKILAAKQRFRKIRLDSQQSAMDRLQFQRDELSHDAGFHPSGFSVTAVGLSLVPLAIALFGSLRIPGLFPDLALQGMMVLMSGAWIGLRRQRRDAEQHALELACLQQRIREQTTARDRARQEWETLQTQSTEEADKLGLLNDIHPDEIIEREKLVHAETCTQEKPDTDAFQRIRAAGMDEEQSLKRMQEAEKTLGMIQENWFEWIRGQGFQGYPSPDEILAKHTGIAAIEALIPAIEALKDRITNLEQSAIHPTRSPSFETFQKAGDFLARITGNRYTRIAPESEGRGLHILDHAGNRYRPEQLSRGTQEQVFLAIRLGLTACLINEGNPPPMVMDDILVNFDPEKTEAVIRILTELSEQTQILFFTCQPQTIDLLKQADPGIRIESLPIQTEALV